MDNSANGSIIPVLLEYVARIPRISQALYGLHSFYCYLHTLKLLKMQKKGGMVCKGMYLCTI